MANAQWIRGLGVVLVMLCAALCSAAKDDVDEAIHGTQEDRQSAIARLRATGPAGLERLMQRYQQLERQLATMPDQTELSDSIAALDQAIERVGGARYCRQSGLYWYTDLEQAKAAARAEGKPILALRMLGNLTDDFSCANSRFFRATLYSNAEISQYLRENFILSWKSVRPVPKVTIDFGDGRKLERTLTGNSIHYILTPDGQVVDALPGLYGPSAFLSHVKQAATLTRSLATQPPVAQAAALSRFHRRALSDIAERWQADLEAIQTASPNPGQADPQAPTPPVAKAAAGVARTKSDVEMPILLAAFQTQFIALDRQTTDETWEQLAKLHAVDATLDMASRRLIGTQKPNAAQAGRLSVSKSFVEDPLLRLVNNLQHSISLDTVKNEYTLHRKLHEWLAQTPALNRDVEVLNDRVYAQLFLTPSSDPWLGLAPPDVYSALPNNGVVAAPR